MRFIRFGVSLLLLVSAKALAVDPSCDTSWSKTGNTWTCSGNGTVTFSSNTAFTPNQPTTIIANNGFYFTNNQIGTSSQKVHLESSYGAFNGSGTTLNGNITASSGRVTLSSTQVNGTISTGGDVDLTNGGVSGKVTSSSNKVTTSGTNLAGGLPHIPA